MEANRNRYLSLALLPFSLMVGCSAPGIFLSLLAVLPVAYLLVVSAGVDPTITWPEADPVGDWTDLLEELAEVRPSVRTHLAAFPEAYVPRVAILGRPYDFSLPLTTRLTPMGTFLSLTLPPKRFPPRPRKRAVIQQ